MLLDPDGNCEECILPVSLEGLVVAAWQVNCWAKLDCFYYSCKDCLLRKAVWLAAEGAAILDWGVRNGILYFDIPGRGQVSFHIFWEEDDPIWELIPKYPHEWTKERNYAFDRQDGNPVLAIIAARGKELAEGAIHNLLVRAWIGPERARGEITLRDVISH